MCTVSIYCDVETECVYTRVSWINYDLYRDYSVQIQPSQITRDFESLATTTTKVVIVCQYTRKIFHVNGII
jgi:hypothetical protein